MREEILKSVHNKPGQPIDHHPVLLSTVIVVYIADFVIRC